MKRFDSTGFTLELTNRMEWLREYEAGVHLWNSLNPRIWGGSLMGWPAFCWYLAGSHLWNDPTPESTDMRLDAYLWNGLTPRIWGWSSPMEWPDSTVWEWSSPMEWPDSTVWEWSSPIELPDSTDMRLELTYGMAWFHGMGVELTYGMAWLHGYEAGAHLWNGPTPRIWGWLFSPSDELTPILWKRRISSWSFRDKLKLNFSFHLCFLEQHYSSPPDSTSNRKSEQSSDIPYTVLRVCIDFFIFNIFSRNTVILFPVCIGWTAGYTHSAGSTVQ
jgi:hypothetical protein